MVPPWRVFGNRDKVSRKFLSSHHNACGIGKDEIVYSKRLGLLTGIHGLKRFHALCQDHPGSIAMPFLFPFHMFTS